MLLLLALACKPAPVGFCEGPVRYDYAPDPATSFTTFPDDFWTVPDSTTTTGLRVSMAVADTPVLSEFPDNYVEWFDHLSTLDGWGLTAGVFFQFTGSLDVATIDADDVRMVVLDPGGPRSVSVDLRFTDSDRTLVIYPRRALPPSTRVAVALLTDPADAACVSPSPTLRALLSPETELDRGEDPPPLAERYAEALDAMGLEPAQIGAMTVFTTQSATETSLAVAEDIAARDYALSEPMVCFDAGLYRECRGPLTVNDYRGPDRLVPDNSGAPRSTYDLPVQVWMPHAELPGPYPVLLCGHGLTGSVDDCRDIVDRVTGQGVALVAVDAVEHGAHPGRTDADFDLIEDLLIFAIRIDPPGINGLQLRDNFRQSAWDKLQVVRAIEQGMDVDGDGEIDLDPERMSYAGVSLGAIMGPELLALSDRFHGAWLAVGGGRITSIIEDSPTFSVLIDLMKPRGSDEGTIVRGFPILQTMVDPGDPMVYAPHVTGDRLRADGWETSALVALALDDQIVPNSTNALFARAFGIPGVGREVFEITEVDFADGPLSANLAQGGSAGVVLFDTLTFADNPEPTPAEHDDVHESVEGIATQDAFLWPLISGGTPVVVDPYGS